MEITAALAGLKTLTEIGKLLRDGKQSAELLNATNELRTTIFGLHEKNLALLEDKGALARERDELKQTIAHLEDWKSKAAHYKLKEFAPGVFAFAYEPDANIPADAREPDHWACPQCYGSKHISPLQKSSQTAFGTTYFCPKCKNEFLDSSKPLVVSVRGGSGSKPKSHYLDIDT